MKPPASGGCRSLVALQNNTLLSCGSGEMSKQCLLWNLRLSAALSLCLGMQSLC